VKTILEEQIMYACICVTDESEIVEK